MKDELVKGIQERRGCFWMNGGLVVWDGPNNVGLVMATKRSYTPFKLDPDQDGDKIVRFRKRRMKTPYIREVSRKLTKAVFGEGFIELPAGVFDTENPDLSGVDVEVREWLDAL